MKRHKLFWITVLTIMAFALAACGGQAPADDSGSTGGGGSDATNLSQTQTVESEVLGGSVSVNYPEGWFAQSDGADGSIFVSNNEEALNTSGPEDMANIPSGVAVVSVAVFPMADVAAMGLGDDVTPTAFLDLFSGFMAADEGMPEFGEAEELTIDGSPAARVSGSDENAEAVIYAIQKEGSFVFALGGTKAGELDGQIDIIQAIIGSASFTPAE